jgi:hypothetical protein
MIAEATQIAHSPAFASTAAEMSQVERPTLTLQRVVASLQVILAARRATRNDDHAYWYTISRGM